jgi:hypothetical protein
MPSIEELPAQAWRLPRPRGGLVGREVATATLLAPSKSLERAQMKKEEPAPRERGDRPNEFDHQTTEAPPTGASGDCSPPPWDVHIGVYPRCGSCGAHVAHASVKQCFHCTAGHPRPATREADPFEAALIEYGLIDPAPSPRHVPPRSVRVAAAGANPAYVRAGIQAELEKLANTAPGARNATLNAVAFTVFGFVKGGHADYAALHAELTRIAHAIGLTASETRSTLNSAWKKATPRLIPVNTVRTTP